MSKASQSKFLRRELPRVIALANSDRLPIAGSFDSGDIKPGEIYALANDSRFSETYFSEPLTTFATGWKDPNNIDQTLEFFAPKVVVPGRLFEWKQWTNAEEFYSESDDIRAIGADFKRVEYTGHDETGKSLNKGLMMRIDLDNVPVQMPGWENRFVAKLLRRLMRNELRRALALLSAAAVNTAKTWNVATTQTADPDNDVVAEMVTAANEVGFVFNRVGYGHTAWSLRFGQLRGNANAAKFATAGFSAEQLADMLNVDQVLVSRERYQSSASAKSELVGNLVYMFYAQPGQDIEDPSNIKRFVSPPPNVLAKNEQSPSHPPGALDVNVYIHKLSPKLVDIYVEYYSALIMTSTLGVNTFTVS
jgi:hypothetical protein